MPKEEMGWRSEAAGLLSNSVHSFDKLHVSGHEFFAISFRSALSDVEMKSKWVICDTVLCVPG